MKSLVKNIIAVVVVATFCCGCATSDDVFGNVGDNIASPSAMYVNSVTNRLYVVNSNSNVLYDPAQGSVQVYDLTNPLAPALIKTAETLSFSGDMYLDTTANRAYVPNRYPANSANTANVALYNFDTDEVSANFLSSTTSQVASGAYGIECCYPVANSRAWITTEQNVLQYVDLNSGSMSPGQITLTTNLSNGGYMAAAQVNYIAIIGSQAFLSRLLGGIMIVNLDSVDPATPDPVPVDYFIEDVITPRGLATDGTNLYVAGEGSVNGAWTRYLLVIDPSTLTPVTTDTPTQVVDVMTSSMLTATVTVGTLPQEPLLTDAYVFVTNQGDNTVSVINRTAWTTAATITVGSEPVSLALYRTDSDGDGILDTDKYVYVGNIYSNNFSIIDVSSLSVVATYP